MYDTLKVSLPKNGSNTYWSIISRIDFVLIKTVGIYVYECARVVMNYNNVCDKYLYITFYCRKCTRIHGKMYLIFKGILSVY